MCLLFYKKMEISIFLILRDRRAAQNYKRGSLKVNIANNRSKRDLQNNILKVLLSVKVLDNV